MLLCYGLSKVAWRTIGMCTHIGNVFALHDMLRCSVSPFARPRNDKNNEPGYPAYSTIEAYLLGCPSRSEGVYQEEGSPPFNLLGSIKEYHPNAEHRIRDKKSNQHCHSKAPGNGF